MRAFSIVAFCLASASPVFAGSDTENLSVADLVAQGGEVANVGSLEGYPIFTVRMADQSLMICRVNFADFSEFADYRKTEPTTSVGTTCAKLD
ncbi:MAG: hypothetical protein KDE03_14370 [Rhodobacteraceae bacterium]|nr:hypothetical protein [Paracoccaceae bacterium]